MRNFDDNIIQRKKMATTINALNGSMASSVFGMASQIGKKNNNSCLMTSSSSSSASSSTHGKRSVFEISSNHVLSQQLQQAAPRP